MNEGRKDQVWVNEDGTHYRDLLFVKKMHNVVEETKKMKRNKIRKKKENKQMEN